MTNQEIIDICTEYGIENYTINPDGSIDVNGNVVLVTLGLTKLPLKFNRVSGYFNCTDNELTSLVGSPNYVGDSFYCYNNQLTSIEGSPEHVGGSFSCSFNKLTSLEGYNGDYDKLYCDNKENLIKKHIRKDKLKMIQNL